MLKVAPDFSDKERELEKVRKLETAKAAWSPRAYHQAVAINGKIVVMGGGNYVPAHEAKNDVWSSIDGKEWKLETANAPWDPRLWFSAAVYRGRIWVLGGWSKAKNNFGDVWHGCFKNFGFITAD